MDISRVKLTYSDLLALPDDGKRHELIDGEHYVTATPTLRHQIVLANLFGAIDRFVRARGIGVVLFAPFDVLLSECDVLEPDLIFVARHRLSILEERFVRGAPDLAVEVLSSSTRGRDAGVKRRAYRRWKRDVCRRHDDPSAAGYYDQSHLIADFKELSGLTPSAFLAESGGGFPYFQDSAPDRG